MVSILPNAASLFEDPKVFGKLDTEYVKYLSAKICEFINQGNRDASVNCRNEEQNVFDRVSEPLDKIKPMALTEISLHHRFFSSRLPLNSN